MKKRIYQSAFGWLFIASALIISCNDDDDKQSTTLYERLGEVEAISAVVDQFLANVASDNRINSRFTATVANESRLMLLRNNLIDQICQGTGGPCVYKGKTMLETHTGMNITSQEFSALVEDLVMALDEFDVPEKEKTELLNILGPMQTDIVGK
jgi:hemoglobin